MGFFRKVEDFVLARTADDTDPALLVWYDGSESTATLDVDVAGQNVQLTIGATVTNFDTSTAAFNTLGELADGINDADDAVHATIIAGRRDSVIDAGAELVLLDSSGAQDLTAAAGVTVFWDTSTADLRAMAIGVEELTSFEGRTLDAGERQSTDEIPRYRDPAFGDTTTDNVQRNLGRAGKVESIRVIGTFGSGISTVSISKCSQSADGDKVPLGTLTTATERIFGQDELSGDGVEARTGERIVVLVENDTEAITASELGVIGALGTND